MNDQTSRRNYESPKLPRLPGVNNIDVRRVRNTSGRSDSRLLRDPRHHNDGSRSMHSGQFYQGDQTVQRGYEMLNRQEADYYDFRSKALITNQHKDAFMCSERDRRWKPNMNTSEYSQDMVERAHKTERELQQRILELQKECDDLRARLSAVFGVRLHSNNPNIIDLSDVNRPTKLAEKFSELYDNEWTNAFEVLRKQPVSTDEETVQRLLQVCVGIYEQCMDTSSRDLKELIRAIQVFNPEQTMHTVKRLIECRKQRYKADTKRIRKIVETRISSVIQTDVNEPIVKAYWTKCLKICWLMVIQDPPVFMDTCIHQNGNHFDETTYRSYTKRGKYIEYIVWPTLYLTERGPILYKGVAQGMKSR